MDNEVAILDQDDLQNKIYTIRGEQVMLDHDIAVLYGVETKRLNEQVRRNIDRFPKEFMFQLTDEEIKELSRSQIATLKNGRGSNIKYNPYAFTEHGVTMLSSVLRSDIAVKASIQIVKAFVSMRHFMQNNAVIFSELKSLKQHQLETDIRIDELFNRMDKYSIDETQGVFFKGQIFDAYAKFESFIAKAEKDIILIDNYVDLTVLEHFTKKAKNVNVTIYTDPKTKLNAQDVQKFNAQYPMLTIKQTSKMHDRFLIIDNSVLYHIGASLKDLGKKCFAFEIIDSTFISMILQNL